MCVARSVCARLRVRMGVPPRMWARVLCIYIPTTKHTFAFSHSQLHNASALIGASLYLPCCLIAQGFFWSDGDA